eukprot:5064629-Lingulodinium_polyedra.AAC.1
MVQCPCPLSVRLVPLLPLVLLAQNIDPPAGLLPMPRWTFALALREIPAVPLAVALALGAL